MSKQAVICSATLIALLSLPVFGTAQTGTCIDQVPTATGDTPAISSSGIFSSAYEAWRAFDSDISSQSMWISEVFETPAWIAYDFGTSTMVDRYQINHANGSLLTSRAPKDFTFEGWNGSSWVILDTRTDETDWISASPRFYDVASPGRYTQYRLHITDDNDARSGVVVISMSDLQFLRCGVIFSGDFESGDFSAWSGQSP